MPIGVAFREGRNSTIDELVFDGDIFWGVLKGPDPGRVLTDRNEARIAALMRDNNAR